MGECRHQRLGEEEACQYRCIGVVQAESRCRLLLRLEWVRWRFDGRVLEGSVGVIKTSCWVCRLEGDVHSGNLGQNLRLGEKSLHLRLRLYTPNRCVLAWPSGAALCEVEVEVKQVPHPPACCCQCCGRRWRMWMRSWSHRWTCSIVKTAFGDGYGLDGFDCDFGFDSDSWGWRRPV